MSAGAGSINAGILTGSYVRRRRVGPDLEGALAELRDLGLDLDTIALHLVSIV
jgi:hypothetical protein